MRIIVQKFGGTSVADNDGRAAVLGKVREAVTAGFHPVVVVSAMGRAGAPYATDTLLQLAKSGGAELAQRELDLLMSCGEIISMVVMVQALTAAGLPAAGLTGGQAGIITDCTFGDARILEVKPENVRSCLEKGLIPVVAGFQGLTSDGEVTTLGRGGSDTTAAALGVALGAEVVEIYTDVDGVMTADPRLVAKARPLDTVNYMEICEMAYLGAKVVHPRAVEIAREVRLPLRIRSTFGDGPGTLVTDERTPAAIEIKGDRVVTGLAHIDRVSLVEIVSAEDINATGKVVAIFDALAKAGISLDMIHVTPLAVNFIVRDDLAQKTTDLLTAHGLDARARPAMAKVSVVGAGMRGVPGVMARVVRSLNGMGIPILQSTDSHTNISCLVPADLMCRAMEALHDEFGLGAPES